MPLAEIDRIRRLPQKLVVSTVGSTFEFAA